MLLIHFLKNLLPHPVFNFAILDRVEHLLDVFFALEGEFVFEHDLDEANQSVLHMDLNKTEVLVAFILENFRKQGHVVLFSNVCLDSINDRGGPFHNKGLKTIFLVEVGIHILL